MRTVDVENYICVAAETFVLDGSAGMFRVGGEESEREIDIEGNVSWNKK